MKYPEDVYRQILDTSCVDVAMKLGLKIDEEYKSKDTFKVKGYGGLFLWQNGRGWFNHSENEKGGVLDLVKKELNCTFRQSLDFVHDHVLGKTFDYSSENFYKNKSKEIEKERAEFRLPDKTDPRRVYGYLIKKRGIDNEIVAELIKCKKLYQEKGKGNCCFVGYDKSGVAKYCNKRGTSDVQFRGDVTGSDKRFGFYIEGKSHILKVFESPIDAISHANLAYIATKQWNKDTRLSLGGLSDKALVQHLADNPDKYDEIWFCLDND